MPRNSGASDSGRVAGYLLVLVIAAFLIGEVILLVDKDGPLDRFVTRLLYKDMQVSADGKPLAFDVRPLRRPSDTLVQAEPLFAALGARVSAEPDSGMVTAKTAAQELILHANSRDIFVNGHRTTLPLAPMRLEGHLMVPLEYSARALGADVTVDAKASTASLWSPAWKAAHPDLTASGTSNAGGGGGGGTNRQPCRVNYGTFTYTQPGAAYILVDGQAHAVPVRHMRLAPGRHHLQKVNSARQVYYDGYFSLRSCDQLLVK